MEIEIREKLISDQNWVTHLIKERWSSDIVIAHGVVYNPAVLPGYVAFCDSSPVGLLTYQIANHQCEIITIDSLQEQIGIGSALIEAVKTRAIRVGCVRLWVVTTNDNLHALGFYQKRGFQLAAVYKNVVERSRKVKPEIPLIGMHGIPIRDEIELEMNL
jgi:GNAT superfamily N-acetyltransferase